MRKADVKRIGKLIPIRSFFSRLRSFIMEHNVLTLYVCMYAVLLVITIIPVAM